MKRTAKRINTAMMGGTQHTFTKRERDALVDLTSGRHGNLVLLAKKVGVVPQTISNWLGRIRKHNHLRVAGAAWAGIETILHDHIEKKLHLAQRAKRKAELGREYCETQPELVSEDFRGDITLPKGSVAPKHSGTAVAEIAAILESFDNEDRSKIMQAVLCLLD